MDLILFIRTYSSKRPVYTQRLTGAMDCARERGWRIQAVDKPTPDKIAALIDLWHPCGVIVENGSYKNNYSISQFLKIPVVFLDQDYETLEHKKGRFGCVGHNPEATAQLAAKELLSLDCAAYAYVPNFIPISWSHNREVEFSKVLSLHGKAPFCFSSRQKAEDMAGWHRNLRRFLKHLPKPCGVFAANDPVGESVLVACSDIGLSVPEEVAVVGVDDYAMICENTMPTLSSVALDFTSAGRMSVELLHDLICCPKASMPIVRTYGVLGLHRRASSRRLHGNNPEVAKVLELIRKKACEGLSAEQALGEMKCSRRLAEMRFRQATGHSPLEEIHARRLERACEMLSSTHHTIETIATMCGYGSAVFLQKLFRRHMGVTPREWRAQNRAPA